MTVEFGLETPGERSAVVSLMRAHEWEIDRLDQGEVWVARDDGEVIGVVHGVEVEPRTFYVESVLIREDRRGAGVGSELMRAVASSHQGDVLLGCHDNRVAFYERLGYVGVTEADLSAAERDHAYLNDDLPSREDHVHSMMRFRA